MSDPLTVVIAAESLLLSDGLAALLATESDVVVLARARPTSCPPSWSCGRSAIAVSGFPACRSTGAAPSSPTQTDG